MEEFVDFNVDGNDLFYFPILYQNFDNLALHGFFRKALVKDEISQAVKNMATVVFFAFLDNVWVMTNNNVGALTILNLS